MLYAREGVRLFEGLSRAMSILENNLKTPIKFPSACMKTTQRGWGR